MIRLTGHSDSEAGRQLDLMVSAEVKKGLRDEIND